MSCICLVARRAGVKKHLNCPEHGQYPVSDERAVELLQGRHNDHIHVKIGEALDGPGTTYSHLDPYIPKWKKP